MTTLLVIGTFLASVSWLLASAWPEKVSRSVSGEFGAKDLSAVRKPPRVVNYPRGEKRMRDKRFRARCGRSPWV